MTLLRSLTHRSFTLLWSGQTLSRVGDVLYEIALAWWVLEQTGSATAMAGVLIFALSPMLIFLLIGGAAVDRLPRVPLMLASDLLRGVIVGLVAGLAAAEALQIWHVYMASLLFGCVDAFFQPAATALVPQLVPAADLPSANALASMGLQLGRVAGPALGAAIVALGGTTLAFALDAASFFVSAACLVPLLRLRLPRPQAREDGTSMVRDVREGFATVLGTPWLWITICIVALTNVTLAGPYQIALPFLVREHFQADVRMLGLLYATFPLGYLIGGLWIGRFARLRRRGRIWYGSGITAGLGMLALGLPLPIAGAFVAAIINGAALEIGSVVWSTTLQELVPNEQLGRVASIDLLGSFALLPVGIGIAGWMTNAAGPAMVCLLGGALTVVVSALGLLHPTIRRLD